MDRFKKISSDYAELFSEVFAEQGLDYSKLQRSVFEAVSANYPQFRTSPILDVGTGDGETIAPFVQAGCTNLTGIDVNPVMLAASQDRFGQAVKLIEMDATRMDDFQPNQFDVILSGACIHNIPKADRTLFWGELLRLNPCIFVAAEKIAEPNAKKTQKTLRLGGQGN